MPTRICPNCHIKLGNYDHFFCSNCGKALPKELENTDISVKVKHYDSNTSVKPQKIADKVNISSVGKILHLKALLGIAFVLAFAALLTQGEKLASIFMKPNKTVPVAQSVKETTSTPLQVVDLPLALPSEKFNFNNLNSYVPAEIDLYIAGNNIGALLSETFEFDIYNSLFSEYPQSLSNPFVLFSTKHSSGRDEWGVIVYNNNNSVLGEMLQESLKNLALVHFDDDFIIVTSHEEVTQSTLRAKNGEELNLTLNPEFVKAHNKLSKEGLAVIVLFNENGRKALEGSKSYRIGNTMKNTIDAILKSGYNELVIL